MRIARIETTNRFNKQYKRLPARVKKEAQKKEAIFRENIFDERLHTHKLHGKEREVWAFYVTPRLYRIKFVFLTPKSVLFLEVGKHDIYK